jgi:hypothetical protein
MIESEVKRKPNGQYEKGHSGNTLTQFKPGNNANPNGRHGSLADLFRELASAKTKTKDRSRHEQILDQVIKMAENGSLKAAEMYFSRIEGKPKEFVEQKIIRDEVVIK